MVDCKPCSALPWSEPSMARICPGTAKCTCSVPCPAQNSSPKFYTGEKGPHTTEVYHYGYSQTQHTTDHPVCRDIYIYVRVCVCVCVCVRVSVSIIVCMYECVLLCTCTSMYVCRGCKDMKRGTELSNEKHSLSHCCNSTLYTVIPR